MLLRDHLATERPELAATGMALGGPRWFVGHLAEMVAGGTRRLSDLEMIEVDGVPIAALPDRSDENATASVARVLGEVRFPLPWRPHMRRAVSPWDALAMAVHDGLSLPAALTLAELEGS